MVKKWDKSWAGLQGRGVHPFDEWHFLAELFIFLTDLIREKSLAGQRFLKRLIKSPQGIDCHRILKFVIHSKLLVFRKNGKTCYKIRWLEKKFDDVLLMFSDNWKYKEKIQEKIKIMKNTKDSNRSRLAKFAHLMKKSPVFRDSFFRNFYSLSGIPGNNRRAKEISGIFFKKHFLIPYGRTNSLALNAKFLL